MGISEVERQQQRSENKFAWAKRDTSRARYTVYSTASLIALQRMRISASSNAAVAAAAAADPRAVVVGVPAAPVVVNRACTFGLIAFTLPKSTTAAFIDDGRAHFTDSSSTGPHHVVCDSTGIGGQLRWRYAGSEEVAAVTVAQTPGFFGTDVGERALAQGDPGVVLGALTPNATPIGVVQRGSIGNDGSFSPFSGSTCTLFVSPGSSKVVVSLSRRRISPTQPPMNTHAEGTAARAAEVEERRRVNNVVHSHENACRLGLIGWSSATGAAPTGDRILLLAEDAEGLMLLRLLAKPPPGAAAACAAPSRHSYRAVLDALPPAAAQESANAAPGTADQPTGGATGALMGTATAGLRGYSNFAAKMVNLTGETTDADAHASNLGAISATRFTFPERALRVTPGLEFVPLSVLCHLLAFPTVAQRHAYLAAEDSNVRSHPPLAAAASAAPAAPPLPPRPYDPRVSNSTLLGAPYFSFPVAPRGAAPAPHNYPFASSPVLFSGGGAGPAKVQLASQLLVGADHCTASCELLGLASQHGGMSGLKQVLRRLSKPHSLAAADSLSGSFTTSVSTVRISVPPIVGPQERAVGDFCIGGKGSITTTGYGVSVVVRVRRRKDPTLAAAGSGPDCDDDEKEADGDDGNFSGDDDETVVPAAATDVQWAALANKKLKFAAELAVIHYADF